MTTQIAVVNYSSVLSASDVRTLVYALQVQVDRDFYPAWGIYAQVRVVDPAKIPAQAWVLGIFDNADQAGALGYHDVTPKGLPLGKVFAKTAAQAGYSVSVTASHELGEMLGDAWVNCLIQDVQNPNRFWIRETGDPVENDADGYKIAGVLVSDLALPSYFQPNLQQPPGTKYDIRGLLTGPVPTLRPGGYMAYTENGQWGQVGLRSARPMSRTLDRMERSFRGVLQPSTFPVH
jgi:hypothetical protein